MKVVLICMVMYALTLCVAYADVTSYDKYGQKTGSYRQTTSGYNSYDKYGQKTGSFRTDSLGRTVEYDKYGQKVNSYR